MKKILFKDEKIVKYSLCKKNKNKFFLTQKFSFEEIERKLIDFDLTQKYGPFKGITRKERFDRAKRFNLNISDKILNLINSNKKFEWAYYENLV